MAGETVLIAAFSGRSLAQSARRAGYEPLVADAFGDEDTRSAAAACQVVAGVATIGFRTKALLSALDELCARSRKTPVGLVLGSGFEDKPRLVAALAQRYRLLGNGAEAIASCNEPRQLFPVLKRLGIAYPETQLEPPDAPQGWLSKRAGGSGGRHIRQCTPAMRSRGRRYFQRQRSGDRISLSALAVGKDLALYFTRQWCAPSDRLLFRYGGAVSTPDADAEGAAALQMFKAVAQIVQVFDLKGALSFDFIVDGDAALLIDVNPRPGASIDVIDDERGGQFSAHVAAFTNAPGFGPDGPPIANSKAAAILHADRGPVQIGELPWPDWSADRGSAGTFVPKEAPLATALADADDAATAEQLARARLAQLEDLIYAHSRPS